MKKNIKIFPEFNKDNLKTGDLLLFHQNNDCSSCYKCCLSFYSCLISCFTKSKYTHCAMVIRNPPWRKDLKGLYILESSYETFPDAEDGERKLGVQLVEFDKMIDDFNGQVYWRHIECNRNKIFYDRLSRAHSLVHNRSYDIIPTDLIKAAFKINFGKTHRKKTFYCSSLVIFVYVYLKLLKKNIPWTITAPKRLGTENRKLSVSFQNCKIHDEIRIK